MAVADESYDIVAIQVFGAKDTARCGLELEFWYTVVLFETYILLQNIG